MSVLALTFTYSQSSSCPLVTATDRILPETTQVEFQPCELKLLRGILAILSSSGKTRLGLHVPSSYELESINIIITIE